MPRLFKRKSIWLLIFFIGLVSVVLPLFSAPVYGAAIPKPVESAAGQIAPAAAQKDIDPPLNQMVVKGKQVLEPERRVRWHYKTIVISLSRQAIIAYDSGRQIWSTTVTTGRPSLPTPIGNYYVMAKYRPVTFYSPWPAWSRFWYPPTTVDYGLLFRWGGYFIHDAWWRTTFGPGTNRWHRDPVFGWEDGSHGCVSMSNGSARWLFNWAPVGTPVYVRW